MTDSPAARPPPLEFADETWGRALVVMAHPDDMEYGGAAAVARWTGHGKSVAYCLATSGEAGIDTLPPDTCGPLREREQEQACRIVGVSELQFLVSRTGSSSTGCRCGGPSPPPSADTALTW